MTDATMQVDAISQNSAKVMPSQQLRLWPGIVIVIAMWCARVWSSTGEPAPSKFFFGLIVAPSVAAILLSLWWLSISRIRWSDRLWGVGTFVAVAAATTVIAGKDFPALGLILFALPVVTTLWVSWLLLTQRIAWPIRRAGVLLIFVGTGFYFSLLRIEGMDGSFAATFNWRWTPTSEAKLLSELKAQSSPSQVSEAENSPVLVLQDGDWPAFRGPRRDGCLTGVRVRKDWDQSPPRELWRHRIGPGWSSCSVIGDHVFTQEQRGDDEFVVCYHAETGEEIWTHHDAARFEEVVAGAGPRGTPTFNEGRVYSLGASGKLNCLDAATGKSIWVADIIKDSGAKIPQWGFASSPLISHGLVSVFAGGPEGKGVVAYGIDSGKLVWAAGEGSHSYCSTQTATIGGVEQILVTSDVGIAAFEPDNGQVLWQHKWPVQQARVVQPAVLNDTDVLLGTGMGGGTRRLSVRYEGPDWSIKELWTTKAIKPYYNDLVIDGDYLYGFDGNIFMCVGLTDGKMQWRARGYGNGQVLLLIDDEILVVLTEQGEVVLVEAQTAQHTERGRFKAIEGKTWNHPVIAHDKLIVRNAEEIACFELKAATELTNKD